MLTKAECEAMERSDWRSSESVLDRDITALIATVAELRELLEDVLMTTFGCPICDHHSPRIQEALK